MDNTTDNEMEALQQQIAELQAKQRELAAKKLEAEKELEKNKEVILTVTHVSETLLTITFKTNGRPRDDVLEVLRTTRSRSYNYTHETNSVAFGDWKGLLERLAALPNVKVNVTEAQATLIDTILHAPAYFVDINSKYITVKTRQDRAWSLLNSIAGSKIDQHNKNWLIPRTEAVRLADALTNEENVVYSEEASKFILSEVENSGLFDKIAKLEDAPDIDAKFKGGQILKPFQRVGVKFILHSLKVNRGGIIGDQVGLGKSIQALAVHNLLKEEWEKENGNT